MRLRDRGKRKGRCRVGRSGLGETSPAGREEAGVSAALTLAKEFTPACNRTPACKCTPADGVDAREPFGAGGTA